MADSSDSSEEEFEFRDPVTGEVVPPRSTLPTSSSNGSKSAAPSSSSTAQRRTTVGGWATPSHSQPRAGPSGSQRGRDVGGSGSVQAQGQPRRQSTGGGNERPRSDGAGAGASVSNGFTKRATSVISLGDTSDDSAGESKAVGRDQVANGRRRQAATPLANGNVAAARGSSPRLEPTNHQQAASSEDELAIRPSSTRRPSHLTKRARQSSPAAPAIRTNGADAAATAAKRASRPSDVAGRAAMSANGSNDQFSSTSAHSSNSTRRRSDAPKQTVSTGSVPRRASNATPCAGPSTSQADAPAQPGPSAQNPPASGRRKSTSTSSAASPAKPPGSSASPSYRVPAALRKALGLSSPNGTSLNGRSPPLTANNLASSVSPTRAAAPSTSQIVKPKPIRPAPPAADAPLDNHPASRQEPRQSAAASSSSAAPATSSAARDDARQANDDQLPLNGRPDLENRQSATASQVGASEAPAGAKDTGDDSDIEILSEVPAVTAVGNAAPAPQGFVGSVSSRSPTPQRAAQPESSRSPTPVPRHQRNLGFAGSSSPEAGEREDQLEVQAGLLADEEDNEDNEDNEDERDEVPLRRQYSRVVPDSDEEGAGPSAPALGRPVAAPRSNISLTGNAKTGAAAKAPRRSHQVARAMSGGFTARKSTTLSRPQSIIPAPVQADEDHLQGLPGSATVKIVQVDESIDGSSPAAQPAPRPAATEQARPAPPAARPGVAKKSTVMTRPPPAPPAPSKPASAPSSKRNAEGPPSDASDAANRAKRPRRAAAAAADAANGKSAQKARKTPRQRAETTVASPDAQVLRAIAIAVDDAEKPTTETLQVTSRADLEMRIEEFVRRQQIEQPWNRVIAGPSYDRLDEFSTDIQDAYKEIFEQMILEANSKEYPPNAPGARPKIRICGPADAPPEAWSSPPFEFIYTNRIVYDADIVPVQAPGCGCSGSCGEAENRKSCSCLRRQTAASKSRVGGGKRSDRQDFAYDRDSCLFEDVLALQDPIIECNSQCGCGPECINRVVGQRKGISVDIFWTGIAGWGVRLSKDYEGDLVNGSHLSSRVRRGAPLAIYAGELMRSPEAYARDNLVYSYIERNYLYDLDHWTIGEEIKARAPPAVAKKIAIAAPEASHKTTSPGKTKIQGKSVDDVPPVNADLPFDNEGFSSFYSIDAYNYGNWTRFANHVCEGFNVVPRPVYVDEGDVTRPLWVYFASRDILPGEDINISYFGESEPNPQDYGMMDAEWIIAANKQRAEAPAAHRCYCNKRLCRGRMFHVAGEMFWEKREAGN